MSRAASEETTALNGLRCAVLGAGGFLGGALSAALHERGADVHAFGRSTSPRLHGTRITWTQASSSDTRALARALEGRQVVFHLMTSSVPETSNCRPGESFVEDVRATVELLDLCTASGVAKVIFTSSGGAVYGIPSSIPTPETAPTDPISAYGIGKLAIEKYLGLYRRLHGLDYVALRIANPYGRGQSPFKKQGVIATMVYRALSDIPIDIWGDGEVTRDFVHVDDVVAALLLSIGYAGESRVMNVGSGSGRTLNQLLTDVGQVLRVPRLQAVYKDGRAADVPVSILDIALIGRELGWRPRVDLAAGLSDTAGWMRAEFHLP